jgi:hypothetical protein
MDLERPLVYGLAAIIILAALFRRSNSLKARRIKGPVFMGDNSGSINQTYNEAVKPPDTDKALPAAPGPSGDRVAWGIGIIGVLVAAAQLAHDVFFK